MNINQFRYSVIIPHYNDVARLERLVLSIPIERDDVQAIVIDDCSPNQASLESLKAKFPNLFWRSTPENRGAGAARNIGIDAAMGDLLVFADSDDEFLPGAFEVFDEEIKLDDDLTYFLADAVQEVNAEPSNRADAINQLCFDYLREQSSASEERLRVRHVNPYPKIYRRQFILEQGLRYQESMVSNDVAFNVMAGVKAERLTVIPRPVYRIYRRADSLTDLGSSKLFLERVKVKADLASWLKANGISDLPSGTGCLVMSFRLGPIVLWKTAKLVFSSDLDVQWARVLSPRRWRGYLMRRMRTQREQRRARA